MKSFIGRFRFRKLSFMYQRKAEKVRYKAYINLELALKNQNVLRANLPLASDQCVTDIAFNTLPVEETEFPF